MAKGLTITLKGDRELIRKLNRLSKSQIGRAIRPGLRAGQKIITAQARRNAPGDTGTLRRNIKTKSVKRRRNQIGIRTTVGEGWYTGETFYGAFQEFGYSAGKRGGENRTPIEGKHFLEEAAKSVGPIAAKVMIARITHNIEQMAKHG